MNKVRKYFRETEGNLSTIFGFSLSALTIGIGMVFEMNQMTDSASETQYLADMAVLAAVASEKKTPWELQAVAENVVNANRKTPGEFTTVLRLAADKTVSVDVSTVYEPEFLKVFGTDSKTITSTAIAPPIGIGKLNIALVVDITDHTPGGLLSGIAGTTSEVLDVVDNEFANILDVGLYDLAEDLTDVQFSIVPFSQYVKIPTSYAGDPWLELDDENDWNGCMGSRDGVWKKRPEYDNRELHGFSSGGDCEGTLQPLTENIGAVQSALLGGINTNDNLYLPAGLMWGWRTLDREVPFVEADKTDYFERERVMLLISDGGNVKSHGDNGIENDDFDGFYHNENSTSSMNNLTEDICQGIKDDGIIIYAIAVDIDDPVTLNLLQNCATDPLKFAHALDDIAFDLIFGQFRKDMSRVRLSG